MKTTHVYRIKTAKKDEANLERSQWGGLFKDPPVVMSVMVSLCIVTIP